MAQSFEQGSSDFYKVFDYIKIHYPTDNTSRINSAAVAMSRGDLMSAKDLLEGLEREPAAFNNLGVYYMLCGDLDKAENYFNKAIVMEVGLEQARKNLDEVKIKREDNIKMSRYKDR